MNYGGDAADQIVRYSMEGMEHTLRISGSIAKNLAVFIVAVLKDQKKTYGKTQMVRMIKERRPTKFFTVPDDRMKNLPEKQKQEVFYMSSLRIKRNRSTTRLWYLQKTLPK